MNASDQRRRVELELAQVHAIRSSSNPTTPSEDRLAALELELERLRRLERWQALR